MTRKVSAVLLDLQPLINELRERPHKIRWQTGGAGSTFNYSARAWDRNKSVYLSRDANGRGVWVENPGSQVWFDTVEENMRAICEAENDFVPSEFLPTPSYPNLIWELSRRARDLGLTFENIGLYPASNGKQQYFTRFKGGPAISEEEARNTFNNYLTTKANFYTSYRVAV